MTELTLDWVKEICEEDLSLSKIREIYAEMKEKFPTIESLKSASDAELQLYCHPRIKNFLRPPPPPPLPQNATEELFYQIKNGKEVNLPDDLTTLELNTPLEIAHNMSIFSYVCYIGSIRLTDLFDKLLQAGGDPDLPEQYPALFRAMDSHETLLVERMMSKVKSERNRRAALAWLRKNKNR